MVREFPNSLKIYKTLELTGNNNQNSKNYHLIFCENINKSNIHQFLLDSPKFLAESDQCSFVTSISYGFLYGTSSK